MIKTTVSISGITCHACIRLITLRVKRIEGVTDIHISDKNGLTSITGDREIGFDEIQKALANTVYNVSPAL